MSIPMNDVLAVKVDLSDVAEPTEYPTAAVTPGEILREEFMRPLGLSIRALASALGVPANRISQIIRGQRAITAGTALRLARYFDTSPELWLNLQRNYVLWQALAAEGEAIRRDVQPRPQAV